MHLVKLKELTDPTGRGANLQPGDRDLISRVVVDLEKLKGIVYGPEVMDGKAIVTEDTELQMGIAQKRREIGLE